MTDLLRYAYTGFPSNVAGVRTTRPAPEQESLVVLDVGAVNRRLGVVVTSQAGACLWGGERLDLGLTVDALLFLERTGSE